MKETQIQTLLEVKEDEALERAIAEELLLVDVEKSVASLLAEQEQKNSSKS